MSIVDLAIIGGGPAGMSAALVAGRARLNTIVVNAEKPRNAVTTAAHGFLTRDGVHPSELLAIAKDQLGKYNTVRYVYGSVEEVSGSAGGFIIRLADGMPFKAARVVLATGYREDLDLLRLPGLEKVYGRSVYPCPFCDGYEHRDERLAVFGSRGVEHFVPVVRIWSEDIVVFTNGATLDNSTKARFGQRSIRVVEEIVTRLISEAGTLRAVELAGGLRLERDAGFIAADYAMPATRFDEQLGVSKTTNDWGAVVSEADSTGKTNIEGIYIIGDAKNGFGGIVESAAEGSRCAAGIVHEIAAERWGENQ